MGFLYVLWYHIASCERLTENVCAVCDVMEMCVSDCIRISEDKEHTFSVRRSQDACLMLATARAQVCVPLGHSSLILTVIKVPIIIHISVT